MLTGLGKLYCYTLPPCTGFLVASELWLLHLPTVRIKGSSKMPPQAPLPTRLQLLSLSALLPLTSGSTGLRLEMHGRFCAPGFLLVHPQLASGSLTQTRKVLSADKCFHSGFYLLHVVPLARREEASCFIFFASLRCG